MKKFQLLFVLVCLSLAGWSQVPNYSVVLTPTNFVITCNTTSVGIGAVSLPGGAPLTVTVTGPSFNGTGTQVAMHAPGSYTMAVPGPTAVTYVPFAVPANTVHPVISSNPLHLVANPGSPAIFTLTCISPTTNFEQFAYPPTGGFMNWGYSVFYYYPGSIGTYTHCVLNYENGCVTCATVEVIPATTGLEVEGWTQGLQVFPNPINGVLRFTGGQNREGVQTRYEVFNATGALVLQAESKEPLKELNLECLAGGLYFLRIRSEERPPETIRFLLQR